jgi:hypothetical protein
VRYGITLCTLGPRPFLAISSDDFAAVRAAQHNLLLMLSIEEKFDALLQNYAEYERELLSLALEHTVFRGLEWSTMIGDLHTVNRRLANVLTMARVYVDHTKQDLNTIYGMRNEITEKLTQAFRASYNESLGYRVMEALRNHIQHRAFPISEIQYPSEWQGDIGGPQARLRSRVVPRLDMQGLRENSDFKRPVLQELEQAPNGLHDITSFLREYIEHLGRVHEGLRSMCREVDNWRQTITETIARYRDFAGDDAIGIVAVAEDDAGACQERVTIFAEPIRRLECLRAKNGLLINLSRRYISNETD